MKICMLTTTHTPRDIRIFHKEAKTLSKYFNVTIIAPNEMEWREVKNNVRIVTFRRARKTLHFLNLFRLFRNGMRENACVYHCHEPDSLLVAIIIKIIKKNCKIIYDVHEHWPSEIAYGWFKIKTKILRRPFEFLVDLIERTMVKFADGVIVVSESVGERFRSKGYTLIENVPLLSFSANPESLKDSDLVLMGGDLQSFHGLEEILSAMLEVKKSYPGIKLKIVGNIKIDIKNIIIEKNLTDNVIFTGFLPLEDMYREISKAKAGIIILKNEYYNSYIGLPNKLFDYMLCGIPVIASDFPEIRRVVRKARCGILVNPTDIKEIAEAILYLLNNPEIARKMGLNGRMFIEREMNWEKIEEKLLRVYKEILSIKNN